MKYLLDTNVISQAMKARPNTGVIDWLRQVDEDSVCLSVVSITELRYGIERLARGKRRDVLEAWLRNDLSSRFEGRIMSVDSEVADACGRLVRKTGVEIQTSGRNDHRGS